LKSAPLELTLRCTEARCETAAGKRAAKNRSIGKRFFEKFFRLWIAGAALSEAKILSFFAAPAWHKGQVAN
jgi:hypothetical protein